MLGRLSCREAIAKANAPLPPTCALGLPEVIAGCQSLLVTVTIEIDRGKLSIANIWKKSRSLTAPKLAMAIWLWIECLDLEPMQRRPPKLGHQAIDKDIVTHLSG